MKIAYLHQYFKTPSSNGGVRSYNFARALVERGHEVHVVTSDSSRSGPAAPVENVDGITVHWVHVPYDNAMGFSRRLLAFAQFAAKSARITRSQRAAVVIATSTPLTVALPALWAVLGRKTRFVFEVRDLWPAVPIAMGVLRNPLLIAAARMLERLTYSRADAIVALSDGMAAGVVRAGVEASKIVVVPNVADIESFQNPGPSTSAAFDALSSLHGRPTVLYCGTFGRVNGLEYMVDLALAATRINSPLAFVAVGDGAERAAVIRKAQEQGVLGTSFYSLPGVPKSELPALLARATFGSSWVIDVQALEDNSANKFFDTLAAGRPMLVNHGGWQADILTARSAGWRLPRDPDAAIAQLTGILGRTNVLESAGVNALQLAREEYALDVLAERFVRVALGD